MIDWVGTTLPLYDKVMGDSSKIYLFVAMLPFSIYCSAQSPQNLLQILLSIHRLVLMDNI